MRSRAREIAAWIVGALVALAVLAWLYDRAAAMPEPLQVDELSRVVRKLASDAREAERLATALTRSQLTRWTDSLCNADISSASHCGES